MTKSINRVSLATLTILFLASFAAVPVAQAFGRGGFGGGGFRGGGGGFGGGGFRGGDMHTNFDRSDIRTNNVRNTSVNNVNINRNFNANVNRGGCCYGGWDGGYHPVATAAAVGATVALTAAAVGSIVNSVPVGCAPINYGGAYYQQCGSVWYAPQGSQYLVVNPPY